MPVGVSPGTRPSKVAVSSTDVPKAAGCTSDDPPVVSMAVSRLGVTWLAVVLSVALAA